MKKGEILNQHSALTTFKILKGKYYNAPVEKGIFALLLREQQELRKEYKKTFYNIFKEINLDKETIEPLMNNIYSLKTRDSLELSNENIKTLSQKILLYNLAKIEKKTTNENEISKLKKNKTLAFLETLSLKEGNYTNKEKQLFVTEIKKHCKDLTIDKHAGKKTIDFTNLAKTLNTNTTRLKKEFKIALDTVLEFNYINRKNIDAEVVSNLIASLEIYYEKETKTNWMDYQIPIVILSMLLLPSVYVPLEELAISKITGAYTMRMYGLLKDHIKNGKIELEKEEVFNFFMLPKSYGNKTNLEKKFLIPTLMEVEKVSGIVTEFEFKPKNKYKSIVFYPKLGRKVESEKIEIIEKTDIAEIIDLTKLEKKIKKVKRNIYVSKAWNKRADNKIEKINKENGEEFTLEILDSLYTSLNSTIETTLVQYMNGMLKNIKKNTKQPQKKKKVVKEVNKKIEKINLSLVSEDFSLNNFSEEDIEKAIVKATNDLNLEKNFFNTLRKKSETIFINTIKTYLKKGE